MTEFTPGQSASVAHRAIISSLKTQRKAERCSLLWFAEIIKRKLYRELGYSSIKHYAMEKLGFSRSQFYVFQNLCLKLEELPCLKEQIETGELDYSKAQAILPVVDKTNEKEWVNKAQGKSRRELQGIVKAAKKETQKLTAENEGAQPALMDVPRNHPVAVVPVIVSMKMSPTQFARYEALWENVWKQRNVSSDKVEAMLEVLESFLEDKSVDGESTFINKISDGQKFESMGIAHQVETQKSSRLDSSRMMEASPQEGKPSPNEMISPTKDRTQPTQVGKPPVQIHIHKCPDCESAVIQTSRGEMQVSETEFDQARCDCTISESNKRNTTSIPPSIRRKVLEQARYKCQRPGCDHTRFLEVHHIVPRSLGGANDQTNLTCLCSGCHRLVHENKSAGISIAVKEQSAVYHWNLNECKNGSH